jgi:hypothetical protein
MMRTYKPNIKDQDVTRIFAVHVVLPPFCPSKSKLYVHVPGFVSVMLDAPAGAHLLTVELAESGRAPTDPQASMNG